MFWCKKRLTSRWLPWTYIHRSTLAQNTCPTWQKPHSLWVVLTKVGSQTWYCSGLCRRNRSLNPLEYIRESSVWETWAKVLYKLTYIKDFFNEVMRIGLGWPCVAGIHLDIWSSPSSIAMLNKYLFIRYSIRQSWFSSFKFSIRRLIILCSFLYLFLLKSF